MLTPELEGLSSKMGCLSPTASGRAAGVAARKSQATHFELPDQTCASASEAHNRNFSDQDKNRNIDPRSTEAVPTILRAT